MRFANFTQTCDGIPGNLPDHFGYYLSDQQKAGACTWYLWPGGDPLRTQGSPENARGNPRFWRLTEKKLWLISKVADLPIDVALLRYVTGTPRAQRFQKLGVINDPGCKAAAKPDAYGLNLDDCSDPYSSGIMGIRLFPNPDFNPAVWNANKFLNFDPRIEPPYLAGLTCGVCHISFNPTKPPADPENPQWENLAPAIGNQYLREGEMFKGRLTQKQFSVLGLRYATARNVGYEPYQHGLHQQPQCDQLDLVHPFGAAQARRDHERRNHSGSAAHSEGWFGLDRARGRRVARVRQYWHLS